MYAPINMIAPALLLLVLVYVTIKQWKRPRRDEERTEHAARELREQLNREDQTRSEGSR